MSKTNELLELLKRGFNWMNQHSDKVEENQSLIERSEPIIKELKTLGISEEVSLDVLLRGAD